MQIERVAISEISLDPNNVRKHNERNLDAIEASLRRFGQQKPVVIDADNVLIAGNGTYEVARDRMGWEHLDCVRSTLEEYERMAYAIADNKTAELATWDFESLARQLKGFGGDPELLLASGWQEWELQPLLQAQWTNKSNSVLLSAEQWEEVKFAVEDWLNIKGDKQLRAPEALHDMCSAYLQATHN